MSGNNGEEKCEKGHPLWVRDGQHKFCKICDEKSNKKKPLPQFKEEYKDAFLHVALKLLSKLAGQDAQICIKPEALDSFPDKDKPIFAWDKSKGHWAAINPREEEPKKTKLALPKRGLIVPP